MNIEIRGFDGPMDWEWVNQQVPILQVEDTSGFIAINAETGEQVAACIMDNWTNNSVQAHFMVTTPMVLRHGFLEFCLDYIFNHSERKVLYGFVPASNEKALKLNAHMGFSEAFRMEDGFADGVDYVVLRMYRNECNYLPKVEAA